MQNYEELAEINRLGEEPENEAVPEEEEGEFTYYTGGQKKKYSLVPILQTACCALILLALLFFKFTDEEKYQDAVNWYQREMQAEIELPALQENNGKEASSETSETESKIETGETFENTQVQNL